MADACRCGHIHPCAEQLYAELLAGLYCICLYCGQVLILVLNNWLMKTVAIGSNPFDTNNYD